MRHDRSIDGRYFEEIFASDSDPWGLDTSEYETAKRKATVDAIADRRYERAFEVGCAQGALTQRLAAVCDHLLAVDISAMALKRAASRGGAEANITFAEMAYPGSMPADTLFDLIVLSEVAYYWDQADLASAARHIDSVLAPNGRVVLVHWTGDTDYPHSGDEAVEALWQRLRSTLVVERADRHPAYRLDLWLRQ